MSRLCCGFEAQKSRFGHLGLNTFRTCQHVEVGRDTLYEHANADAVQNMSIGAVACAQRALIHEQQFHGEAWFRYCMLGFGTVVTLWLVRSRPGDRVPPAHMPGGMPAPSTTARDNGSAD
jgi:hypothetical protein